MTTRIDTSIYPYRDGTLVELLIVGHSVKVNGNKTRDWNSLLTSVRAQLDAIFKE